MTIGAVVLKEFRSEDGANRVSKLVKIYDLLKRKGVPNVDTLERSSTGTQGRCPYVHLSPVGLDTLPQSGSESFDAIVCVLQALTVRYACLYIYPLTSL